MTKESDPGAWEVINLVGCFNSVEAEQIVAAKIAGPDDTQLLLRRLTTHGASGYVDVMMRIGKDTITCDWTPFESLDAVFQCVAPAGLLIRQGVFEVSFKSCKTLAIAPSKFVISLHGTRWSDGR